MKINRLLEISLILLNKKAVTAQELAERFKVSTRTIYRDVDELQAAGRDFLIEKSKRQMVAEDIRVALELAT